MPTSDQLRERQEVEDVVVRLFVATDRRYDVHLTRTDGRWRIGLFRFNLKFIEGNRELEKAT